MEPSLGTQTLSTKRTEPAYGFGRPHHKFKAEVTPGPKYVQPQSVGRQASSLNPSAPTVKFGTSKQRPDISEGTKPGPGAYVMPSSLSSQPVSHRTSAPSFTLSSRHKEVVSRNDQLGPGQCREDSSLGIQAKGDKPTAPKFSFPTSHRSKVIDNRVPGPASYGQEISPYAYPSAPAIGLHFRTKYEPKHADSVGPGRCREDSSIGRQVTSSHPSAPGFSMTARNMTRMPGSDAPPPGSYEVGTSMGKQVASRVSTAPAYTMSGRHAVRDINSNVPGPNLAAVNSVGAQAVSEHKSAPKFSFGTSSRPSPVNPAAKVTPGPSAYTLPGSLTGPGKSFSGRTTFGAIPVPKGSPAPGAYETTVDVTKTSAPAFGFSRAVTAHIDSRVPGPGSYATDRSTNPGGGFSISGRHTFELKPADTVGPGRCRTDNSIGRQVLSHTKSAPGHIIASRLPSPKPATDVPGPGSYGDLKLAYLKPTPPPLKASRRPKVIIAEA